MTTRFKVLIVDDQNDKKGVGRVLEALQAHNFVGFETQHLVKCPDDASLEWEAVWYGSCRERGLAISPLEYARELLQSRHGEFDAFFFDLDLSKNEFLPTGEYVERTYESLGYDERSSFLAGLDLLRYLALDERPKIFFSGSPVSLQITRPFDLLASRLADVTLPNIGDDADKRDKIARPLSNYLRRRQQAIIRQLPRGDREELVTSLRAEPPWRAACDLRIGVDEWTVRTLFPQQANAGNLDAILAALAFDWRAFYSTVFNHPNSAKNVDANGGRIDPFDGMGGVAQAVDAARGAEVGVRQGQGLELAYPSDSLRSALDDVIRTSGDRGLAQREALSRNLNTLAGVRRQILDSRGMWFGLHTAKTVEEYLTEEVGLDVTTQIKPLAKNFGVRPLDLAYLFHVASHNAHAHVGAVPKLSVPAEGCSAATVTIRIAADMPHGSQVHWEDKLNGAWDTVSAWCRSQRGLASGSGELWSEGLADLCTLVCGYYRGRFTLRTPVGSVAVVLDERSGGWAYRKTDAAHPDGSLYEIDLSRPGGPTL